MSEEAFTTDEVRDYFAFWVEEHSGKESTEYYKSKFDQWLARHDAVIYNEGRHDVLNGGGLYDNPYGVKDD